MTLQPQETEPLNRDRVLEILRAQKPILKERFDVEGLWLVGSLARGESRNGSDIDLIVEFAGAATADGFFGANDYLESVFGCEVDLMTEKGLREGLHPYVADKSIVV